MNQHGSKPYGEDVRLRAVKLVCEEGWKPGEVAQAMGCSVRSIQLWVQKSSRGRKKTALKTGKAPGATPKLDSQQKQRLLKLLAAGPEAAGFEGQLWTCARINELIQNEFDVSYHVRSLPALLKSLGWSVQKPKRRAMERNEQAIEGWVANDWSRIKKNS